MFNSIISYVNKISRLIQILLKKNLKLNSRQQFYAILIFLLMAAKTDLHTKEKYCK